MKAIIKKSPELGLWIEDVPKPEIKTHEVLIKIRKTAICGTDLHIYLWNDWARKNIPLPLTIGHEFMGEVVEIGSAVKHVKIGDRVSGEGHITCGYCRNCRGGRQHLCQKSIGVGIQRNGAFAEYLSLPEQNVWPIHKQIPDEIAAFFDPLGNAAHTALSFDMVAEDVLITGAGPIGIMAAAICRFIGARNIVITDVNDYRLDLAEKMGATRTINVNREKISSVFSELNMTSGFDRGLEMSGNPQAFNALLNNMYQGGRVALLGILPNDTLINWENIIFKGLQVKGIYGREMFETWYKMSQMLRSGLNMKPVLTHEFPVDDYQQGFDIMESGLCGKVILEWI